MAWEGARRGPQVQAQSLRVLGTEGRWVPAGLSVQEPASWDRGPRWLSVMERRPGQRPRRGGREGEQAPCRPQRNSWNSWSRGQGLWLPGLRHRAAGVQAQQSPMPVGTRTPRSSSVSSK